MGLVSKITWGGSLNWNRVLLRSIGSPTRSFASWRVVYAHMGLCCGSSSTCTNCSYSCFQSYDYLSELRYEVESKCADSSSRTSGRKKVPTCNSCGACKRLCSKWTLCWMMIWSLEGSMSMHPFTLSRYPTKIHAVLWESNVFLFLEGIQAHAREPKTRKWITSGLFLLEDSKGVQ
jgi:hypothetical protein